MDKGKTCKECGKIFKPYKTTDKYCCYDCAKKHVKPKNHNKSKKKNIKPISDKRVVELSIYRPLRDKYMIEHPTCEVKGCFKPSNDLHHKAGRIGYADKYARDNGIKLLWDVRFFMAICRIHHNKCDVDPVWAKESKCVIKFN